MMTATQILATLSADPWVHARVWQYDMEQTVGVVARSYAAAVFREGGTPPNAAEAAGELRYAGNVDGGHSAEWWAVQLLREIGWLLCAEHPDGIKATEDRWFDFGVSWAKLVQEMEAWLYHHMDLRPAVEAGTHRFGLDPAWGPKTEWLARKQQEFRAVAKWVDGGGMDRFRSVARQWALRADKGLHPHGPVAAPWMSATAFRAEVGTEIVPLRLPPDPGQQVRIQKDKGEWEVCWAARQAATATGEAAWKQWQAAVDAAFPGIPWHGQTAYRGGVGPH